MKLAANMNIYDDTTLDDVYLFIRSLKNIERYGYSFSDVNPENVKLHKDFHLDIEYSSIDEYLDIMQKLYDKIKITQDRYSSLKSEDINFLIFYLSANLFNNCINLTKNSINRSEDMKKMMISTLKLVESQIIRNNNPKKPITSSNYYPFSSVSLLGKYIRFVQEIDKEIKDKDELLSIDDLKNIRIILGFIIPTEMGDDKTLASDIISLFYISVKEMLKRCYEFSYDFITKKKKMLSVFPSKDKYLKACENIKLDENERMVTEDYSTEDEKFRLLKFFSSSMSLLYYAPFGNGGINNFYGHSRFRGVDRYNFFTDIFGFLNLSIIKPRFKQGLSDNLKDLGYCNITRLSEINKCNTPSFEINEKVKLLDYQKILSYDDTMELIETSINLFSFLHNFFDSNYYHMKGQPNRAKIVVDANQDELYIKEQYKISNDELLNGVFFDSKCEEYFTQQKNEYTQIKDSTSKDIRYLSNFFYLADIYRKIILEMNFNSLIAFLNRICRFYIAFGKGEIDTYSNDFITLVSVDDKKEIPSLMNRFLSTIFNNEFFNAFNKSAGALKIRMSNNDRNKAILNVFTKIFSFYRIQDSNSEYLNKEFYENARFLGGLLKDE